MKRLISGIFAATCLSFLLVQNSFADRSLDSVHSFRITPLDYSKNEVVSEFSPVKIKNIDADTAELEALTIKTYHMLDYWHNENIHVTITVPKTTLKRLVNSYKAENIPVHASIKTVGNPTGETILVEEVDGFFTDFVVGTSGLAVLEFEVIVNHGVTAGGQTVSVSPTFELVFNTSKIPLVGDVNGDDLVNSTDLLQIMQRGYYEEENCPGTRTLADGDINGDRCVTSDDLVALLQSGNYQN